MKKLWWKIPAIILASLLGIILLILTAIPLLLTSERLTRWVNDYGTEYLVDGQVYVKKLTSRFGQPFHTRLCPLTH